MPATRKEVTLTRVVRASRDVVFRAWTDPELVTQWWGPRGVTTVDCVVDARPGGAFDLVMVAGDELGDSAGERWPMRGVFDEVVPPERLVFSSQALDDDGSVMLEEVTTVLFEDEGDGTTKVTVHAAAEGSSERGVSGLEGMTQGWSETLDKLVEFASAR